MGKGRKVKQIFLGIKRIFTRCFPCYSGLAVTPDDGIRQSETAVGDKNVLNESSTFLQRIYIPMTAESLADPDLFRYSQILRARFSQLHAPSKYAGNQCTSAALFSLVMRTNKQFTTWDTDTIDEVLLKGTELHRFLRDGTELTNHPDMRVSLFDLPEHVPVFVGDTCFVARGTAAMVFGQVACEANDAASLGEEFPKLYHYLQNVLSQETSVLVTVGEYTVAIAMEASRVWLFDSHSRDESGMLERDFMTGKACLLAFAMSTPLWHTLFPSMDATSTVPGVSSFRTWQMTQQVRRTTKDRQQMLVRLKLPSRPGRLKLEIPTKMHTHPPVRNPDLSSSEENHPYLTKKS